METPDKVHPTSKKRIPKSCSSCRQGKTRCDELRPRCGRCCDLGKHCQYAERPKTVEEQRIADLQAEVRALKEKHDGSSQRDPQRGLQQESVSPLYRSPHTIIGVPSPSTIRAPSDQGLVGETSAKRRRISSTAHGQGVPTGIPDFVTEGIITEAQASHYFGCFFEGADRFVPIFDEADTLHSIRSRNGLLFNAICAVGCGASRDITTESRVLHVRLKRWLSTVILNPSMHCLETVQALLVTACWMPENNIVIAVAMRMAIELQLADSFDRLLDPNTRQSNDPEAHLLMKRARTWLGLVVLAKILQVDAGDLLGFSIKNVRRCRSLLNQPYSTTLDTRLFSQVELNHLRAKIGADLLRRDDDGDDEPMADVVSGARVDLSIWYDDWKRIVETCPLSGAEMPSLLTNLAIQWHWADAMTTCTAFRLSHGTGHDDDAMSGARRGFLQQTKTALHRHLDTMLANPRYLDDFKYAMDFVWAKGTYCFLLLLKLSFLLEDTASQGSLLGQGQALHDRLSAVVAAAAGGQGGGRSVVYLQLLAFTLSHHHHHQGASPAAVVADQFVPDEFVFDWDFPVLNLAAKPHAAAGLHGQDALFDQFLADDDNFLMETLESFWAQAGNDGTRSRQSETHVV